MPEPNHEATTRHVRAAIADDRASVDWIVRRFSPLLEAQARMRLHGTPVDAGDAEDVADEAWLIALPRLADLVPREGRVTPVLLKFLGTTIRSLCNRRIERSLRRRATSLDSVGEVAAPPAKHRTFGDPATAARVRASLDALVSAASLTTQAGESSTYAPASVYVGSPFTFTETSTNGGIVANL